MEEQAKELRVAIKERRKTEATDEEYRKKSDENRRIFKEHMALWEDTED